MQRNPYQRFWAPISANRILFRKEKIAAAFPIWHFNRFLRVPPSVYGTSHIHAKTFRIGYAD